MRTSDFDYQLPSELIAQTPLEPRDASRLLVLHRESGELVHRQFQDLPEFLRPGDVMVFNQSRVIPARLHGKRRDTGGRVELLLLRRESPGVWEALGKPGRRLRPGVSLIMERPLIERQAAASILDASAPGVSARADSDSAVQAVQLEVEVLSSEGEGIKRVRLSTESGIDLLGEVPLPPYIHQRLADPERYQTVYSREPGSVAAPTAGLHFTELLLAKLVQSGIELAYVTLHVGLDTFRPIHDEDPTEHKIHTEYYELSTATATILNRARSEGRRIIAVGTTSVRVLEQVGRNQLTQSDSQLIPASGQADLFILPGHQFRLVEAMITNFHLPRSSLLMLVSAFAGREFILRAYGEAIAEKYRFYSFGDATLIV